MPILKTNFIATPINPTNAVHTVYCSILQTKDTLFAMLMASKSLLGKHWQNCRSISMLKVYLFIYSTMCGYLKRTRCLSPAILTLLLSL